MEAGGGEEVGRGGEATTTGFVHRTGALPEHHGRAGQGCSAEHGPRVIWDVQNANRAPREGRATPGWPALGNIIVDGSLVLGNLATTGPRRILAMLTTAPLPYLGSIATGFTFQISSAYWRMVRSLENLPERATLSTAMRVHCSWSSQALETSAWQAS